MNAVGALALKPGQVFIIPGHEGTFKCLFVGEFKTSIESLIDGSRWGIEFDIVVDVLEPKDTVTKLEVPASSETHCEPVPTPFLATDPISPSPVPFAA